MGLGTRLASIACVYWIIEERSLSLSLHNQGTKEMGNEECSTQEEVSRRSKSDSDKWWTCYGQRSWPRWHGSVRFPSSFLITVLSSHTASTHTASPITASPIITNTVTRFPALGFIHPTLFFIFRIGTNSSSQETWTLINKSDNEFMDSHLINIDLPQQEQQTQKIRISFSLQT